MVRRRLGLGALLLLALMVTACSDSQPDSSGSGGADRVEAAPDYRALTMRGDTVTLRALQGKPVLLNLWATWCPPCREEMPSLQRVHQDYAARGLQVVGVSIDSRDARAAIARFVMQYGISFTILHDPEDRASGAFRTFGLPETFLIDAEGRLVRRWRGKVDGDSRDFRKALDRVVSAAS